MDEKLELKEKAIWLRNDIKSVLQDVYDHYRALQIQNEYIREEIEKVKSEKYADEELSRMKSEYEKMKSDYYRGFPISEEEGKKINEWIDQQMTKHPGNGGAIGGRFQYVFVPTGVGTAGVVEDTFTNESFRFQEIG